ncbi:MAG: alpha/beta hydrolase [Candidatus Heimdallarchaeota archaeon]|nr:MAG: alpha/beta hydrolase [Candidatus Heimdallarchaeota archaeon]
MMFGALLIHSLFTTNAEMQEFAEYLESQHGFRVSTPLLPGHGTFPEDLKNYRYTDWIEAADEALRALNAQTQVSFVVGQVTSAPIVLSLATFHPEVLGIATLSGFISLSMKQRIVKHALKLRPKMIPWASEGTEIRHYTPKVWKRARAYDKIPKEAIYELIELINSTRSILKNVDQPIYVIQSTISKNVDPKNAQLIFNGVSSTKKKLLSIKRGGSLMSVDEGRHIVFREVANFFWSCIDLYQM